MPSIFLQNVSHIDGAYISADGRLRGLSVNPLFCLSGTVNNTESVVLDFGKARRVIKDCLDCHATGYDHKLWVDPLCTRVERNVTDRRVQLRTPYFALEAPPDAVRFVDGLLAGGSSPASVSTALCGNAKAHLASHLPCLSQVAVSPHGSQPTIPVPLLEAAGCSALVTSTFNYTHGLPHSSSYGCQNIVHGHSSFCVLGSDSGDGLDALAAAVRAFLHNKHVYDTATLISTPSDVTSLAYETKRGVFALAIRTEYTLPIPIAPTIENLAQVVANQFRDEFLACNVRLFGLSEGLWKGAFLTGEEIRNA